MSVLQNAIDSIELGVEDFESKKPKRLISSVRNTYAGILLLFKHKLALLSRCSDDALTKHKVLPVMGNNGKITWKGKGKKTVDVQQIQERFESLGIKVDWKRLEAIRRYRNEIEHYFGNVKAHTVRQYISDCFIIVRDFITDHLGKDPRQVLGQSTWDCLVNEKRVYDAEKNECSSRLEKLDWPNKTASIRIRDACCSDCSSDLIRPVGPLEADATAHCFECCGCGCQWDYEALLSIACGQAIGSDSYAAVKDGDGPMIGYCPGCGNEGYDATEAQCAFCGTAGPFECSRCGATILVEELAIDDGRMCGWCAHFSSKDD